MVRGKILFNEKGMTMTHRLINSLVGFGAVFASNIASAENIGKNKPNILWIEIEDTSPWMSIYGDNTVETPNINELASEGVVFSQMHVSAPVCSACRSALMVGCMQTTYGLHNHRSSYKGTEIYLPKEVKTLPEIFKENGYFTACFGKKDYNFAFNVDNLYDKSSGKMWHPKQNMTKLFAQKKPWFIQLQLLGGKYRKAQKILGKERVAPKAMKVPDQYPDIPEIRDEVALHYATIKMLDRELGEVIKQLKKSGQFENTVIFFFSDHGCRMPRAKQFVYGEGTKVPMIVYAPKKLNLIKANTVNNKLTSSIDISASSLAAANIKIPKYMEGKDFFKEDFHRDFVVSARDRCDYSIDYIRAINDGKYLYIRNFMVEKPYMQPQYRDYQPLFKKLRKLAKNNQLTEVQQQFFKLQPKPKEELYIIAEDPNQINNQATNKQYIKVMEMMRKRLANWQKTTDDKGQYPESLRSLTPIFKMWNRRKGATIEWSSEYNPFILKTSEAVKLLNDNSIDYRVRLH